MTALVVQVIQFGFAKLITEQRYARAANVACSNEFV